MEITHMVEPTREERFFSPLCRVLCNLSNKIVARYELIVYTKEKIKK